MSETEATGRVGVFGKLPAVGDFVNRGLPPSFADRWHGWLADGLVQARTILGARFEPAYAQAPVWRIALQPEVGGDPAVLGLWMPSVDAAGRAFPLTLVSLIDGTLDLFACLAQRDWLAQLEALARAALHDATELTSWLAQVEALPAPPAEVVAAERDPWTRLDAGDSELPELIGRALLTRPGPRTALFWGEGSPFVPPGALFGQGLPQGPAFARLILEGDAQ